MRRKIIAIIAVNVFLAQVLFAQGGELAFKEKPEVLVTVSLNDCIKYAAANSFEVKIAKLDLYIAETDLMYSEAVFDTFLYGGASYAEDKRQQLSVFAPDDSQTNAYYAGIKKTLPIGTELDAKVGDTRSWNNSPFSSKNPAHTAEVTLEGRQPLAKNIFGYVDRKNITLTRIAIENADLESQDRISAFFAKVEKAYWELVYAKRKLAIYNDILDKAKKLDETNKKNFKVGLIEKVDMHASEANLATLEAEIRTIENRYNRAAEDLKLLMNMEEAAYIVPADEFEYEYFGKDLSICLKTAFNNRRDYKMRKKEVEIKGLTVKVKGNMMWPEIDLVATMAFNGVESKMNDAIDKVGGWDNSYYFAGVEVSIPIENKAARSEYIKAQREKEKVIVQMKETERTIITEVGNDYNDVMSYQSSLAYIEKAVQLQSEKLKEEEKRFSYGRSNTKRLIDYQEDLLRAESEEALYLLSHRQAQVDLDRSMNIILEQYEDVL